MKPHYTRHKGYRRYTGWHDRPVYYMLMSKAEVRERWVLYGVIGSLVAMFGGAVLWILSMI